MTDETESFANHPVSVSEARSDREQDMTLWTPRDVLICLLRDIDKGELDIETLVVCYRHKDKAGDYFTSNTKSAPDMHRVFSVLEVVKSKIMADFFGLFDR